MFEDHEPSVRRLLVRIVRDREEAEDLSAETFVRFWKSARKFRGDCSLRTYLTRIALNLARDRLRRRRVPQPYVASNSEQPVAHRMPEIESAMAKLEPTDREILALYYLDELSYEEIAAALKISYDVLRTRLVRARKRLRALMGVD